MLDRLVYVSSARRATAVAGLASILISLPYLTPFLGPREQEVRQWGVVSLALGVALLGLSAVVLNRRTGAGKLIGASACLSLALLQGPPIALWLVIGAMTDNVSPYSAAVRVVFAAGHAAVLVVAVVALTSILRCGRDWRIPLPTGAAGALEDS